MKPKELQADLQAMVAEYEPCPGESIDLGYLTEEFATIYHAFTRNRPLAGLLQRKDISPDRQEAEELAGRLSQGGSAAFLAEVQDTLYLLQGIGVIQQADIARLNELCRVSAEIAAERVTISQATGL